MSFSGSGLYFSESNTLSFTSSEQAQESSEGNHPKSREVPADVQKDIDQGVPPSGNMISCPNCKYYPADVQNAVKVHERRHLLQMLALGLVEAAACSAIGPCRRAMELDAYRAESNFVNKRLSQLDYQQAKGSLSSEERISQRVLKEMKRQEDNFFRYPSLLDDK